MLNPAACARLERVLAATGADIVLSSSWRHATSPPEMQALLHRRGVASARVVDRTPDCAREPYSPTAAVILHGERGHEIQMWLDGNHDVESFAIVDDGNDMAHLRHRLVRTTWATGMLDEHADALIAMLGAKP